MKISLCVIAMMVLLALLPVFESQVLPDYEKDNAQVNGDVANGWSCERLDDPWSMFGHDKGHTSFSGSSIPDSNETLWINETSGSIRCQPIIVDDRVYFGSFNGYFYCLDAFDGSFLWSNSTGLGVLYATPVYSDEKIIATTTDGNVYCFDALTGELQWTNSSGGTFIIASPVASQNHLYIGTGSGTLVCMDINTGEIEWTISVGNYVSSSPALFDDKVYVGSFDGMLHCYDITDGSPIWMNSTDGETGTPTLYNNNVYVCSRTGQIYCFDATDGTLYWNESTGGDIYYAAPSIGYDAVYIGTTQGNISSFQATDGLLLWRENLGQPLHSTAAIADEKLVIGSQDHSMYCLEALSGDLLWSYQTDDAIDSSASVYGGNVYIGSNDGNLYCVGIENQPPGSPLVNGTPALAVGFDGKYTAVSNDNELDPVYYRWDFGDGNMTSWFGPYESGEPMTIRYNWSIEGTFPVRVKAKDITQLESEWSDPLLVTVADQITAANINEGYIYLRFIDENASFIYISLLNDLGISIMLGADNLYLSADTTDHVVAINFEVVNYVWGDNESFLDEDGSDGFSTVILLPSGIWSILISAYNEAGELIDTHYVQYLFYKASSAGEPSQLDQLIRLVDILKINFG